MNHLQKFKVLDLLGTQFHDKCMVYHIRSQQISTVRYCLIAHTNLLLECSVFTVVLYLALQRHYAILEALALGDDEMPETADETVPDEEGMAR